MYTPGTGLTDQDRLREQARSLGALSEVLLDRVGMRPGWSADRDTLIVPTIFFLAWARKPPL